MSAECWEIPFWRQVGYLCCWNVLIVLQIPTDFCFLHPSRCGYWMVSTAFLQKVGELNEGWGMHIPPGIPAHWCLWLDRRIKMKFLVFNPVRQCSFSCTSTSGGLKFFKGCEYDILWILYIHTSSIHVSYLCMYIYIYVVDATLLPMANQIRKLGKSYNPGLPVLDEGLPHHEESVGQASTQITT